MRVPFLSIICPIRNSEKTLGRMLDSILSEEMDPEDYEIIACDDGSTDSSLQMLHQFVHDHPDINMSILCTSPETVHCPAAARQYGLAQANGEWVRFLDSDDTFINQGCTKFFEYIRSCNTRKVMVKSEVIQVSESQQFLQPVRVNTTILHGNFYNRMFLMEHKICFSSMMMFEDMYFNSSCCSNVFYFGDPNRDFGYMNEVTYSWTLRPDGYTNEMMEQCKGHLELFLIKDWIQASFDPFEKYLHIWPVPNVELFKHRLCQTTFGLYYYYENGISRQGLDDIDDEVISDAETHIKSFIESLEWVCEKALRCDMIDMLYSASDVFCEEYYLVTDTNNYFVPEHSLKEFLQLMTNRYR